MTKRIILMLATGVILLMGLALPVSASVSHSTPPAHAVVSHSTTTAHGAGTHYHGRGRADCLSHYRWKVGQDFYVGGERQWGEAWWTDNTKSGGCDLTMQTRVRCVYPLSSDYAYSGFVKGDNIHDRATCNFTGIRRRLQIQFDRTGSWKTLWSS